MNLRDGNNNYWLGQSGGNIIINNNGKPDGIVYASVVQIGVTLGYRGHQSYFNTLSSGLFIGVYDL